MTIRRPDGLKCLDCGNMELITTATYGPARGFMDFTWRNMLCKRCGERIQWGDPLPAGEAPRVMKVMAVAGPDGKTRNINMSLPIGATLKELIAQSTKVRNQKRVYNFCGARNKTVEQLTPAEKRELISILEVVQ